eukprot:scaffold9716_cov70-Phaeocystis_antarctica.AAC.3
MFLRRLISFSSRTITPQFWDAWPIKKSSGAPLDISKTFTRVRVCGLDIFAFDICEEPHGAWLWSLVGVGHTALRFRGMHHVTPRCGGDPPTARSAFCREL